MLLSLTFYVIISSLILILYGRKLYSFLHLNSFMAHILGFIYIFVVLTVADVGGIFRLFYAISWYLWSVISIHAGNRYWYIMIGILTVVFLLDFLKYPIIGLFISILQYILNGIAYSLTVIGGIKTIMERSKMYWSVYDYAMAIFKIGMIPSVDELYTMMVGMINEESVRFGYGKIM